MRGRYRSIEFAPLSLRKERKKGEDQKKSRATDIGQREIKEKGISDDDVYEMRDGDDLGRKGFRDVREKERGGKSMKSIYNLTYWTGIQSRLKYSIFYSFWYKLYIVTYKVVSK